MKNIVPFGLGLILAGVLLTGTEARGQTEIPLWYGFVNNTTGITSDPANGMARLGIYANIGGAADTNFYVFDTGSENFVSAAVNSSDNPVTGYGGSWWGAEGTNYNYVYSGTTVVSGSFAYVDNSHIDYYDATAAVTVAGPAKLSGPTLTTAAPVAVSQGYAKRVGADATNVWAPWQAGSGTPPPDQKTFYGTMGADLQDSKVGLYAISTDYAAHNPSLKNGFIMKVGSGSTPSLTVGLTTSTIQTYSDNGVMVQMQTDSAPSENAAAPNYKEQLITATYTLTFSGSTYRFTVGTTLDTGEGGSPVLYEGDGLHVPDFFKNGVSLADGVTISMEVTGTDGNSYNVFNTTEGDSANGQAVKIAVDSASSGVGSVNTGLAIFYQNNVMFDAQDGLLGLMAVPEPTSSALMLGGLAVGLVAWRKRTA